MDKLVHQYNTNDLAAVNMVHLHYLQLAELCYPTNLVIYDTSFATSGMAPPCKCLISTMPTVCSLARCAVTTKCLLLRWLVSRRLRKVYL